LGFGLAGDACDRLAAGQAVTDGCAHGAATEGQTTADHGSGQLDRIRRRLYCHFVGSPLVSVFKIEISATGRDGVVAIRG